jgi:hypothetical protein
MNPWYLNGKSIAAPQAKSIDPSTQSAHNRTIDGQNNIDYIGSEKFVLSCHWSFISQADFNIIKAEYDDQRLNMAPKILQVDALEINAQVIVEFGGYSLPIGNNYDYRDLTVVFRQV